MQRKSLKTERCPVARTLDLIGEWWSLLILRDAFRGKNLGLAKNVLSARLRKLVDNDILEIVPASDGSAYHEYVLTEKGNSLYTILVALRQWGEANLFKPGEKYPTLVDRKCSQPVKPLELRSKDGRLLKAKDVQLLR
jgi:DNA-binding HxlR family transcriptional regulator